jgi:hypothetical protein
MRAIMLFLLVALEALAACPASACIDSTSHPFVNVERFDPFGAGGAVRNFSLSLRGPGGTGQHAYVQLVDHDAQGGAFRIGGELGPYTIVAATGQAVLAQQGDTRPPGMSNLNSPWVAVNPGAHGEMVNFQLQINPDIVPAGVYDKVLDLRVACPSGHGYTYTIVPAVVEIHVAVDNVVKLVGGHNARLDFGDLAIDGPPSKAQELVGLRASGAFNIAVRSEGGVIAGANSGVMMRENAGGLTDADRIPYRVNVQNLPMNGAEAHYRCGGAVGAISIAVQTNPSPGAGKHAGTYRDILHVTLTPDFYGQVVDEGRCKAM